MTHSNRRNAERTLEPASSSSLNSDYLRGYRDGLRDRRAISRPATADGLLGALLAVALLTGLGYLGFNYVNTGRFLPSGMELRNPLPNLHLTNQD